MYVTTLIRLICELAKSEFRTIYRQTTATLAWSRMKIEDDATIGREVLLRGSGMVVVGTGSWLIGDSLFEVGDSLAEIVLGANVRIERGARLTCRGSGRIHIGARCVIGEGATLISDSGARIDIAADVTIAKHAEIISGRVIELGDSSSVGAYTTIGPRDSGQAGALRVGRNCHISDHNVLDTSDNIVFGDDVRTGHFDLFHTHNHSVDQAGQIWDRAAEFAPIRIGNGTWIGSSVNVLPGVDIGTCAVVGAGAVVTKPVNDYEIVGGVPARVLRVRVGGVGASTELRLSP